MAANVGTAYVTVLPSMKGFGAAVSKEFQGAGTAASAAFGKTAAKGFEQAGSESGGKFLSSVTSKLKGVANVATKAFGIVGAVATGAFMKGGIDRALNIEQAQFKLKGMGMDVESVMASCNTAVSGTAFGLAAAATAAANMGAAGVAAGDQMTRSLQPQPALPPWAAWSWSAWAASSPRLPRTASSRATSSCRCRTWA